MIEIDVPKRHDGYVYTIKSIDTDAKVYCADHCFFKGNKEDKCNYSSELKNYGISFGGYYIHCIKVVINVKNEGNLEDWYVGAEDAHLIDSEGFSYDGVIICDKITKYRTAKNGTKILPNSQLNYIQLFPLLKGKTHVSSIKIDIHHRLFDFNLSNIVCDNIIPETKEPDLYDKIDPENPYSNDFKWEIDNYKRRINNVKVEIFERFDNILTTSERTKLENRINRDFYAIELDLTARKERLFDTLKEEVKLLKLDYNEKLKQQTESERKKKSISQKIDELMELTPREFEEYVGQLYHYLGFEDVVVTQYSNDKGIDILLCKEDLKYGIQCKRYKGTVGSPDIQKFIGALDHAKADKGIFVTTGMFSFEAEKMASEHPIELVNRIELAKLILEATNKK